MVYAVDPLSVNPCTGCTCWALVGSVGFSSQKSSLRACLQQDHHWESPSSKLQRHQHRKTCQPMQPIPSSKDYEWFLLCPPIEVPLGVQDIPKCQPLELTHWENISMLLRPQSGIKVLRCESPHGCNPTLRRCST